MPRFAAIRRGTFARMPAAIEIEAPLTISVDSHAPAIAGVIAAVNMSIDTDLPATIPDETSVIRAIVTTEMSAEVDIEATLTIRTGNDTGFPYTFPIIFGGGVAPETFTTMPAVVEIEAPMEMSVESHAPAGVSIIAILDMNPSGFPYTFPIIFGGVASDRFPYTFPFTFA